MHVQVFQLGAHLAGSVKLEFVTGRDGQRAKATCVAISNHHWGSGEERQEKATSIRWTLWGKQAENAAQYLGKGSHVNITGHMENNNYTDGDGKDVFGFNFIVDDIGYLDSKSDSEQRRSVQREAP